MPSAVNYQSANDVPSAPSAKPSQRPRVSRSQTPSLNSQEGARHRQQDRKQDKAIPRITDNRGAEKENI